MKGIAPAYKKNDSVVRKLRASKLKSGLPFMIHVKELPSNQCYYEYPDGSVKLITVTNSSKEIVILKKLTLIEAKRLRQRLHFELIK
ncbi:hypothetical protein HZQ19_08465 [Elizabethkingia anophelis]|uniref:hypothetical protein n=1 Tax=Elizabethkingia anophelis TaxID=1117645 RepID=UPI0004E31C3C|nr:hypothetical protein [Elizabethkingia anophelis]AQW96037.1 hypothetical protein BBD30_18600 [Elizabethkingia anophelis]KFC34873.1 hypothetical protein FF18_05855 [Elizabethkingia anophelis]MCT3758622.1 hypothetical protein [Elizabethkingia anophelis]MCT3786197.1 hypothetical protein [Elizabethkingia anophelis]MCT3973854.1 hypothetical protein [Elizabethkingia anophelis]